MQIGSSAATRAALLVASLVLAAAPSRALTDFSIVIQGAGGIANYDEDSDECAEDGQGIVTCDLFDDDLGSVPGEGFYYSIGVVLNPDPEIHSTGVVTNMGPDDFGLDQFTMTITLFGNTGGLASEIEGDWQSGIADSSGTADNDGNYATLSTVSGSSFYSALIDNVVQETLFDDAFAQVVDQNDVDFNGSHSGYVDDSFGIPVPDSGPVVTTSIGVKLDFAMTGGFDTAEFTEGFKVKAIPEPTTALLFGLGLVALARAGRRR
jgi:hypothetical protein